jgi:hypothetical protein
MLPFRGKHAGRRATGAGWFLAATLPVILLAVCLLPVWSAAQAPEYFEGTRWYDFRPGLSLPKDVTGNLMVSARDEKLTFFWEHSKMLEVAFDDLGGMFYEFAPQPSKVEMPPKGWRRLRGKRPRHLLTLMVRQPVAGKRRGTEDETQDTLIIPVLFELTEAQFGKVLLTLEAATQRSVERLEIEQ